MSSPSDRGRNLYLASENSVILSAKYSVPTRLIIAHAYNQRLNRTNMGEQGVAVRASVSSESQLTEQETDGEMIERSLETLSVPFFLLL